MVDFRLSTRRLFSVTIIASGTFAWWFLLTLYFENIYSHWIGDQSWIFVLATIFYGSGAISAIPGSLIGERINHKKFLLFYFTVGVLATAFLTVIQNLTLAIISSALLGVSLGLGFPSCLALLYDYASSAERARFAGTIVLETFIMVFLGIVVLSIFDLGVIGIIVIAIMLRSASYLGISFRFCERERALNYLKEQIAEFPSEARERMFLREIGLGDRTFNAEELVKEAEDGTTEGNRFLDMIYGSKLEKSKEKSPSWLSILTSKQLFLYLFPWLAFNLAGELVGLIWDWFRSEGASSIMQAYNDGNIVRMAAIALLGPAIGIIADRRGRKSAILFALVILGFSFSFLGLATSELSVFIYTVISGIAWSLLMVSYLALFGDMALSMKAEKYYALGISTPLIAYALVRGILPILGIITAEAQVLSPILGILIFVSIIPVLYTKETLSKKTIEERELREHLKKMEEIVKESRKTE